MLNQSRKAIFIIVAAAFASPLLAQMTQEQIIAAANKLRTQVLKKKFEDPMERYNKFLEVARKEKIPDMELMTIFANPQWSKAFPIDITTLVSVASSKYGDWSRSNDLFESGKLSESAVFDSAYPLVASNTRIPGIDKLILRNGNLPTEYRLERVRKGYFELKGIAGGPGFSGYRIEYDTWVAIRPREGFYPELVLVPDDIDALSEHLKLAMEVYEFEIGEDEPRGYGDKSSSYAKILPEKYIRVPLETTEQVKAALMFLTSIKTNRSVSRRSQGKSCQTAVRKKI